MADVTLSKELADETRVWLEHVHAEQEKRPATELFACFTRDLTIQVVNQATQFIQQAFDWRSEGSSQKIDKAQFRRAKCSLYLYYRVLQGVLLERQRTLPEATQDIVDDAHFTQSLLLVAVELVVFAWQGDSMVFPVTTLRMQCMHLAFDMLAATDLFRNHLAPAPGAATSTASSTTIPPGALEYLGFMRVRVIEELALLNGSRFFSLIGRLGSEERESEDVAAFEQFLQTYTAMARERCFQVYTELAASVPALAQAAGFEALAQQLLSHLLLSHFYVAFNQHQLNLISCCVYSAARVLGTAVPFRRINETIAAVFPLQDPALFLQADVGSADEVQLGDTRQLYNNVFLPPMEEHLQSLIAAQRDTMHDVTSPAGAAVPAGKSYGPVQTPSSAAAPTGSRRTPLGPLSASDRNVRRHSTQPR